MWSSEQVKKRLEELRSHRWLGNCHEHLEAPGVRDRLGEAERVRIGLAIFPNRKSIVHKQTPHLLPKSFDASEFSDLDAQRLGARALAGLSQQDRRAVFEAMVPRYADVLEAGWQMTAYRTLDWSYSRRLMVRSPRGADLSFRSALWAVNAVRALGPVNAELSEIAPLVTSDQLWSEPSWSDVFAAAINAGGPQSDALLQTLLSCLRGEHEVCGVNQKIIETLVMCERPEAWEAIEKLLLAAQRQEGIRQSILESFTDSHPDVFPRFLRLILEHDLSRFSSVVRAADVWFGLLWDSASRKIIDDSIRSALGYIEDPDSRDIAVRKGTPAQAYFALWAAGFEDIEGMLPLAARALDSKDPEVRFAAAHACGRARVETVRQLLIRAIGDTDLRVAAVAADAFRYDPHGGSLDDDPTEPMDILPDAAEAGTEGVGEAASPSPVPARSEDASVFDALLGLLSRIPEKDKAVRLKAALWPWTDRTLKTTDIADAMADSATSDLAERLLPVVRRLSPNGRAWLALRLGSIDEHASQEIGSGSDRRLSPNARAALLKLMTDASPSVSESAMRSLARGPLLDDEFAVLLVLLQRRTPAIRGRALVRLLTLADDSVLSAARTLLFASTAEERSAGLELLDGLIKWKKSADRARALIEEWTAARGRKLSKTERAAVERLTSAHADRPKREDAFGLIDPARLTKPSAARPLGALRMTPAAWRCMADLATLVVKHKDLRLPTEDGKPMYDGETSLPLGSSANFYSVARPRAELSREVDAGRCPIREMLDGWLRSRGPETRDADRRELLRAVIGFGLFRRKLARAHEFRVMWPSDLERALRRDCAEAAEIHHEPVQYLLDWALRLEGDHGFVDAILNGVETSIATGRFRTRHWSDYAPFQLDGEVDEDLTKESRAEREAWVREVMSDDPEFPLYGDLSLGALGSIGELVRLGVFRLEAEHHARLWRLALMVRQMTTQRADEKPGGLGAWSGSRKCCAPSTLACGTQIAGAVLAGAMTEDDLLEFATNPYWGRVKENVEFVTATHALRFGWYRSEHGSLPDGLSANPAQLLRQARAHPVFFSASHRLRERLIELELGRGDAPTEASVLTRSVAYAGGAGALIRCLVALDKPGLKRTIGYEEDTRRGNLSHLVSVTIPATDETPDRFAELVRQAGFTPPSGRAKKSPGASEHRDHARAALTEDTLVDAAVYVPHWAGHIEHALGEQWRGLEDAVWWIHAHTKDSELREESTLRDSWQASIAERTPLTEGELKEGAVDVEWFHRVRSTLGTKQWVRLDESAKFACTNSGHRRAQLFAAAMTGGAPGGEKVTEQSLTSRVKSKRHQDSIRALGLVPIKKGPAGKKQVLERYKLMQEIRRTSRKHGGQLLQASERRAVEIGMENLARTAGYPDPLRLQWSMEREDLADLAKGPVSGTNGKGDKAITVSLAIDADGAPELTVTKNGKPLASVPAAIKKDPKVAQITGRVADLRKARSRVRTALEEAMCRGDAFTGAELADLQHHPILRAMLARLVLVHAERPAIAGYPDKGGKVLRSHSGDLEPLKSADALRIAHPIDLLARKDWEKWQRECFAAERVQPFKQIFREVYVPTAEERAGAESVKRYEGHQVNPRQALALLGSRHWVFRADEGVQRTFHRERRTARLQFAEHFYTPAEVEGLTLEALEFTRAGEWKPLKVADVPPRLFSECMRDLDLVVSVAHRGGVDPEASRSTTAMRAAIVRETCALLKLSNVVVEGEHPEPASPDAKANPKTKAAGKTRLPADPVRVRITGQLAEYTVHLGSAGVSVSPLAGGKRVGGGSVWIIPVHAQHRGRLFLPFADDDPKTAEVVSKVLLLARDRDIQDPSILSQIRAFVG